jgi:aspartyl/asparaginyl-tRNA synthetase
MEYLREVAHLRPRTNTFGAVARVRTLPGEAIHRFFHERGFFWIHTPIITASDAEGAGEMFRVSTLDLPTCRARRRARSTSARTSSAGGLPDRLRPAQRGGVLPAP